MTCLDIIVANTWFSTVINPTVFVPLVAKTPFLSLATVVLDPILVTHTLGNRFSMRNGNQILIEINTIGDHD